MRFKNSISAGQKIEKVGTGLLLFAIALSRSNASPEANAMLTIVAGTGLVLIALGLFLQ